jgi:hypothetical protein
MLFNKHGGMQRMSSPLPTHTSPLQNILLVAWPPKQPKQPTTEFGKAAPL